MQEEKKTKIIDESFFVKESLNTDKPVLAGSRCKSCGKIFFPKQKICSNCFKSEMQEIPLSRTGKLYTYTIARYAPPGFKTPYAIGYVDLPEGVRVFSQLTECEPFEEKLKMGMDVEMVMGEISMDEEGVTKIGYKFKPLKRGVTK